MSELLYGNRPMDPEPENISLESLCGCLRRGETVLVKLEPGDATHYALLIVPAWAEGVAAHLGRYGIRRDNAHEYLIVTKLDDAGGQGFYAFSYGMDGCDWRHIGNGWTQELFTWWFNLLWTNLRHPDEPPADEEPEHDGINCGCKSFDDCPGRSEADERRELEARREDQAYDTHIERITEP